MKYLKQAMHLYSSINTTCHFLQNEWMGNFFPKDQLKKSKGTNKIMRERTIKK